MAHCYNCELEITKENTSVEHVIPNACGGRLKSSQLLCRKCNKLFGEKFDKELAKQTNHLANLLTIERDRNEPPSIRAHEIGTGVEVELQYGQRPRRAIPKITQKREGDILHVQFTGGSEKQLTEFLKSLEKKYPSFDIDEARKMAKRSPEYLSKGVKLNITLGGEGTFRSITKTANNFYMLRGGNRQFIQHLLNYIMGEERDPPCMIHYPQNMPYLPDSDEISHVIKVIGDSENRILYAYIEIFNCHNFIVLLNDDYQGADYEETYIFDVLLKKEISRPVVIEYSKHEISGFLKVDLGSKIWEAFEKRMARVLAIVDKIQVDLAGKIIMEDVLKNSLGKYPEGIPFTEDILNEFNEVLASHLSSFLEYRFKGENDQ